MRYLFVPMPAPQAASLAERQALALMLTTNLEYWDAAKDS